MRILNLEDSVTKHVKISDVVNSTGKHQIDWVKNLEDGIEKIQKTQGTPKQYDLFISDMYYPKMQGGGDADSGMLFVEKMEDMGIKTPIIICSTVRFRMPNILGTVHFSENEDWESELRLLINSIE